jgi:pseudouridine-5'-phosphate glycosidase
LTLEYLETRGVTTIGFGTAEMPAFYTIHSGFPVDYRLDSPAEVAAAFRVKTDCGLRGGLLVGNPIAAAYAMDSDYISQNIAAALQEAQSRGITGKAITPFLLDKIQILTGGRSLEANIQLVYSNAALGAKIAREYCQMTKR